LVLTRGSFSTVLLVPASLFTMKVSRDTFDALLSSAGPDVSFSVYHECLHSIAFTHAKVLSLPRYKFIDPSSPVNADGTITLQFLPHWRQVLLLPLFLRLIRLYLKPQLRLSDSDYQLIVTSFDGLPASDVTELLGVSLATFGRHLHIIRSVTLLEHLCAWTSSDSPLDYFLHLGGNPMITLGDILIRDDVQHTITRLLSHVGSPSPRPLKSIKSRSSSHSSSRHRSHSRASHSSSIGSRIGTHISVVDSMDVSLPDRVSSALLEPTEPLSTPTPLATSIAPAPAPLSPLALVMSPDSKVSATNSDPPTPITRNPITPIPTPIARPASRSSRFPNVDPSTFRAVTPRPHAVPGRQGTPVQSSSIPKSSFSVHPASSLRQPRASPSGAPDAAWDQYSGSCSQFHHLPTSRQHVLRTRAIADPVPCNTGAHWTHYILDPNDTHPIVDPLTNSIPPWRAYRPDHDVELIHFPAAVPNVYVDRDLFLSSFTRPWDAKNQADFLKHFPPLPSKATTRDLLPFYNKIVPHCRGYYVFVPPLSTLRSGVILGTWFADLTTGMQSECLYHFSALLLTALRQKATGLMGHASFDFIVTGTDDGYFALYQLAQLGGHPLLTPFPIVLTEPLQSAETDLATYLGSWIHFLTAQALSGCFLSDRYFILKFVVGLHSSLRSSLGTDLEHQVDHPRFDNRPLPFDFTPAHLWVRLQQRAQFIGFRGHVLSAPRDVQRPSPIHQVLSSLLPSDDSSSFSPDLLLAAISSSSTSCFFCHNTCHTAEKCPLLLRTKSDPFARRIVLRLLQDLAPSARSSDNRPTPTSATRKFPPRQSSRVHALGLTDGDVVSDSSPFESPDPVPESADISAPNDLPSELPDTDYDLDFYSAR